MDTLTATPTTDTSLLKEGDIISYTQYFRYIGEASSRIHTVDQFGDEINISKSIVERGAYNGTQYTEEVKMSRTELIKKLHEVGDTVFTANFVKQEGEERTITCRMIKIENGFGRSQVVDLNIQIDNPGTHAVRQIDHRTLNWIILRGVKYSQK